MLRKLGDMLMYFYASVLFSDCSEKNKAGIAHRSYQRKLEQFPAMCQSRKGSAVGSQHGLGWNRPSKSPSLKL